MVFVSMVLQVYFTLITGSERRFNDPTVMNLD